MFSIFSLLATTIATATEWRTQEAFRAFGKPGDTVEGSATINEKQNKSVPGYSTDIPPRDSQAYKDYIRKLQQKQKKAPSQPSYSRSTTTGDENSEPSYSRSTGTSTGSKEEVWLRCRSGILDKLKQPSTAVFDDDPMWGQPVKSNGNFDIVTHFYSKEGGVLKKFLGSCEGNTTDYSSLKVKVWLSDI
jgi:hypothetical protein